MNIKHDEDELEVSAQPELSPTPDRPPMYRAQSREEQIADLQLRLAEYVGETEELARRLSITAHTLRRARAMLTWIINSRSWKLTSILRQIKFVRSRFQLGSLTSLVGELENPAQGIRVNGSVEVSGWAYSTTAPIVGIEAFIDGIPLAKINYGQPRPDVSAYPNQAPINCGYHSRLRLDESLTGKQKLIVRIVDQRGRVRDYSRTLLIEQKDLQLSPMAPASEADTTSLLRDDLSIARRLQTSIGHISLQSFLLSNLVLRFPEFSHPELSIIVVLHNRAELTLQCLCAILRSVARPYEVIIVDNASTDQTNCLLKQIAGVQLIQNEENVHYLLACNQAGEQAKGSYLLLLNNDAQLQAQTIPSALSTLESDQDIGAVGGKIVLPDGTLQEAGSIIWSDGSCLGYGRGNSPLDPAFMFKRDVDYCSGVFLLTRRDLFMAGGGFDKAYAPAYFEETDYCVRLWRQGKRVVYDPDATVLHYEFASSATRQTAIDMQNRQRSVFVGRHADWLKEQLAPSSTNILAARARRQTDAKRILLLDDRVPHISLGSGFPRTNRMVREMVALGHQVTCYPLTYSTEEWSSVYSDLPREVEVMIDCGLTQLEQFLDERTGQFDVVLISRPHNMALLRPLIEREPRLFVSAQIIYDAEALFSIRQIEWIQVQGGNVSAQDRNRMVAEEIALAEVCDRVISVSEREAKEFTRLGIKNVYTLGHALTPAPASEIFANRNDILFVGAIHEPTSPNADSILWFSRQILPRIQKLVGSQVRLVIAGVMHPAIEVQLKRQSIQIKGPVNDLSELYDQCRIFVAPTRFAAGLPHKVHEAAAHGLPTVATRLIGSQLGWENGRELLLADSEAAFAEACAELYLDPELWCRLRISALSSVAKDCSSELFRAQLRAILD